MWVLTPSINSMGPPCSRQPTELPHRVSCQINIRDEAVAGNHWLAWPQRRIAIGDFPRCFWKHQICQASFGYVRGDRGEFDSSLTSGGREHENWSGNRVWWGLSLSMLRCLYFIWVKNRLGTESIILGGIGGLQVSGKEGWGELLIYFTTFDLLHVS